jgi:hypothetical protein
MALVAVVSVGDRWLKRTPVGRTAAVGFAASWVKQESSGGGDVQLAECSGGGDVVMVHGVD